MRNIISASVLAIAAAAFTVPAMAADLPVYVDDVAMKAATSWDGFYVGVGAGYVVSITTPGNAYANAVGILGGNVTFDSFLLGAEIYAGGEAQVAPAVGAGYGIAGGSVRAGFLAGDSAVVYVLAGGEVNSGAQVFGNVGAGVEFMVTDSLSLDLQYKYVVQTNGPFRGHSVGASLNWHFN